MHPVIYKFNEHNEAFYYWEKARLEKIIKPNATLIHVDSHSDLGVPYILNYPIYSFSSNLACSFKKFIQFLKRYKPYCWSSMSTMIRILTIS